MEEKKDIFEKLCEQIEKKLEELSKQGIQQSNVDYIFKLVDIKKDIKKMEKMEENNMYRGYDGYGNYDGYDDRMRGYGRNYSDSGSYGRGYGRRYRGHDMIDEMGQHYGTYMESREGGRYGGPETAKSFDYMLKSAKDFFRHLKQEAKSPEEFDKIKMTAREISEM